MTPPRKPPRGAARTRKAQPRFAAHDDAFWEKQETRLAGQLGQPCCTLSGMCTLLGGMRGNFAVIIHGERDCGNSFVNHRMESAERFFGTCLTDDQITTGRVDDPLEQCLRLVLDEAFNNAILHGNEENLDAHTTNFIVKYFVNPEEITFVVEDTGNGFNFNDIPDPTSDENLLSINGRGIYLMKNIMDSVFFNEKGKVVLRINGYHSPQRFNIDLDYVALRKETELSYRDYLKANRPAVIASRKLNKQDYFTMAPFDFLSSGRA